MFLMLYLIYSREITVGQFFSLFLYSLFIFGPLQELGTDRHLSRGRSVVERFRGRVADAHGTSARGPDLY
jgi:hypothetical protein